MDLPERLLPRVCSRLGLTRIIFSSYNREQLEIIITSRLKGLNCFSKDAIEFLARKIATVSGDARRALQICIRATEIAEQEKSLEVDIAHVETTIRNMYGSTLIIAMQNIAQQEKIFMCAVALELKSTGAAETTFGDAAIRHAILCKTHGYSLPNSSILSSICARMGACKLLNLLDSSRTDLNQRIKLNLMIDDIEFAIRSQDEKMHEQFFPS